MFYFVDGQIRRNATRFSHWLTYCCDLIALVFCTLSPTVAKAADPVIDPKTARVDEKTGRLYYDIRPLGVEGQGWTDVKAPVRPTSGKVRKDRTASGVEPEPQFDRLVRSVRH